VLEGRSFLPRQFRGLVPSSDPNRIVGVRHRTESIRFGDGERTTLKIETAHRCSRQKAEIGWVDGAKIALCRDVQSYRPGDGSAECLSQILGAEFLVAVVYTSQARVLVRVVKQVANIVQKCSRDERSRRILLFSQ